MKKYIKSGFIIFMLVGVSVLPLMANMQPEDTDANDAPQTLVLTPAPTETWWKPCQDCSDHPDTPDCVVNGKETYQPQVLFSVPWSQVPKLELETLCADQDGNIYLLWSGAKPIVQVRTAAGKVIRSFPWQMHKDGFSIPDRYEIRVDEKKDIVVIPVTYGGTGHIYDSKGVLTDSFENENLSNLGPVLPYKTWFKNGIVFNMKNGQPLYVPKSFDDEPDAFSSNTLKDFQWNLMVPAKTDIRNVTFQNETQFPFQNQLDHGRFLGLVFVDDVGNLYARYSITYILGSWDDGNKERGDVLNFEHIYKFDSNLNLLAGFQFQPTYIDPSTGDAYVQIEDDQRKEYRIVLWHKIQ